MEYDLLIRGGRVVDGSGFPSYRADVGVKDGTIFEVGHIPPAASAPRTIDAGGLVVAPGFMVSMTCGAFPHVLVGLVRAFSSRMVLGAVAAFNCCLALGSYVAIFVTLIALLQTALSVVSFALEDFSLPDESFIDDLVGILWPGKLDDYR